MTTLRDAVGDFYKGTHPLETLLGPVLRRTIVTLIVNDESETLGIYAILGLVFSNLEALYRVANDEPEAKDIHPPDTRCFLRQGADPFLDAPDTALQRVKLFELEALLPDARRIVNERNAS